MSECLDCFSGLNCDPGCGCESCRPKTEVLGTQGGCTPIAPPGLVHSCRKGPDQTVAAPVYVLTIENPPDDILRDAHGFPVIVDGKTVAK